MFRITDGVLKISVRNLVEFVYNSGDIDNRTGSGPDTQAMLCGTRIHKKIQKKMGSLYEAEVPLKMEIPFEDYSLNVWGRADGIFYENGQCIIDEIKSMYMDVTRLEKPLMVHLSQAKCYAYMYALSKDIDNICIQMTYVNIDTEEINRLRLDFTKGELTEWFEGTINEFRKWSDFLYISEKIRNNSIKPLEFPFEYRKGQRNLCVSVYKSISRQKVLFIQAPTGVGKTISTVFPAVKAMGEDLCDKIFYLTAKTITRTVAQESFDILRSHQLRLRTITITAKEKICENGLSCNPVECIMAKGHFDRVNEAVYDIITNEERIDRECITRYAKKHNVCPFEFSLDVSYWCDAIICDYNYVFDPNAYLRRFFAEDNKERYVFLIDEAHNLVERGREMYSASLSKNDVMEFKRIIKGYDRRLYNCAQRVNNALLEIKRKTEKDIYIMEAAGGVTGALSVLFSELSRFNEEKRETGYRDKILEFFFKVRDFLNISEIADENYVIYSVIDDDGDLILNEYCVNPSNNINACIARSRAAILFSATLLPIKYYKSLLRGCEDDYAIYAESPFENNNRKVLIARDVTTRYTDRTPHRFKRIYEYIKGTVNVKYGNYMVFFPSYGYMESILSYYEEKDFDIAVQKRDMNEEDKENFLREFEAYHTDRPFVGFCVMGGIFSEGIDLKEESLIGVIVAGTGLPQVGVKQDILMEWFSKEGKGFEYAYIYPGLNKVLQSAGRVIRTEKDRGIILLLDNRFLGRAYDGLMPAEWSNMEIVDIGSYVESLIRFWK